MKRKIVVGEKYGMKKDISLAFEYTAEDASDFIEEIQKGYITLQIILYGGADSVNMRNFKIPWPFPLELLNFDLSGHYSERSEPTLNWIDVGSSALAYEEDIDGRYLNSVTQTSFQKERGVVGYINATTDPINASHERYNETDKKMFVHFSQMYLTDKYANEVFSSISASPTDIIITMQSILWTFTVIALFDKNVSLSLVDKTKKQTKFIRNDTAISEDEDTHYTFMKKCALIENNSGSESTNCCLY